MGIRLLPKCQYCCLMLLLATLCVQAQNPAVAVDSSETPFRKGRWLTGLSGSIRSNTNSVRSIDEKTITNEFGLNLSTGRFIKDRWLFGGKLNANRASSAGAVDRTTESLYVGPFLSHYLTPGNRGSLFTTVSAGYVRFREETQVNVLQVPTELLAEGGGFGTLVGLGYSYVIHDKIAFDIGLDLNLFWIGLDQEQQPSGDLSTENIAISNIAFTFGFNVILDDFFF